jgi:hypothetical protein
MIIDILVLLVLALSALIAFLRGFIREVLTIFGVLGGMVAAYYAGPMLLPLMEGWLGVDPAAEDPQKLFDIIPYTYVAAFLAYGSIFVIVVVILSIISHMIAEAVKSVGLGAVDLAGDNACQGLAEALQVGFRRGAGGEDGLLADAAGPLVADLGLANQDSLRVVSG